MRCELCNCDTGELFSARDYRRPLDRREYSVRWCHQCTFGRIDMKLTPEDVRRFFDIPYYTHGPNQTGKAESLAAHPPKTSFLQRAITNLAWRADYGCHFTADELGPANNRTLCDLGCGDGQNLQRFKDVGFNVCGVEPDPAARVISSQIAPTSDGTLEALPTEISSCAFDVVLLSHVLDVCSNLKAAISNVRSILRKTGTAIIEVPNCAATGFRIYGPEWPWTDVPRHQSFFTEKSLTTALEAGGFCVRKVQYVGYTRQFSPYWSATQAEAHDELGTSRSRIPSCLWLAGTALASKEKKYDSIRVHATPIGP